MSDSEIAALKAALASGDAHRQKNTARLLGEMGAHAYSAIPDLLEGIRQFDPAIAPIYANAICCIDPSGKRVVEILKASKKYRDAAAYTLARLPRTAIGAISHLVGALGTKDRQVRTVAVQTLRHFGSDAVPSLLEALKSNVPRNEVLQAIAAIGPEAKEAIPVLEDLIEKDQDPMVAITLNKLGVANVRGLANALLHGTKKVRRDAAKALEQSQDPYPAISELLAAARDPAPDVRRPAIRTLARLGRYAEGAAPSLAQDLRHPAMRKDAQRALGAIGTAVLPFVIPILHDDDVETRLAALRVLSAVGRNTAGSLEIVSGMALDSDEMVRRVALESMFGLAPASETVQRIVDFAVTGNDEAREVILRHHIESTPALIDFLQSDRADVRVTASELLEDIGAPAVSPIIDKLQDMPDAARPRAARVLRAIAEQVDRGEAREVTPHELFLQLSRVRFFSFSGGFEDFALREAITEAIHDIPESDRYTDLALYAGDLYDSDDLSTVPTLADDEPFSAGSSYTLTVAIREERIGVEARKPAPRRVQVHREGTQSVDIYVHIKAFSAEVELRDTFAKITWPYDEDSTDARFRFGTLEFFGEPRLGKFEVRLYDEALDLLDLVVLNFSILPQLAAGDEVRPVPARTLKWPNAALSVTRLQKPPRLASISVTEKTGGYELDFLFRNARDTPVSVKFRRDISAGDLEQLLARVRDFWTSLVIGNYAERLNVAVSTYAGYLDKLRDIGIDAWNLLFGSRKGDQQGTSERIGELVAALEGGDGACIQIVHGDNVRAFVFPWSLLHPPSSEPVDPLRFWGARFQIEQVSSSRGPDPRLNDEPVIIGFALDPKFGNSDMQTAMFNDYRTRVLSKLDVSDPVSSEDKLLEQLTRDPAAHVLYFFCHGYAAGRRNGLRPDGVKRLKEAIERIKDEAQKQALEKLLSLTARMGDESWIHVGDSEVTERVLKTATFFQHRRPIVFLNMCQSADLLPSMSDGFVRLFLDRSAAAVIGTESPMTAVFAAAFAKSMFDALFAGKDLGTALLETRRHFLGAGLRNPLGLAYTLYGRATARVGASALLPIT